MSWKSYFNSKSPIKNIGDTPEGETESAKAKRIAQMDFYTAEQESSKRFSKTPEGKAARDLYMNNQVDDGAVMDTKTGLIRVKNRMTGETNMVNVGQTKKIKRDYENARNNFRSQDAEYQAAYKKIKSGLTGGALSNEKSQQGITQLVDRAPTKLKFGKNKKKK